MLTSAFPSTAAATGPFVLVSQLPAGRRLALSDVSSAQAPLCFVWPESDYIRLAYLVLGELLLSHLFEMELAACLSLLLCHSLGFFDELRLEFGLAGLLLCQQLLSLQLALLVLDVFLPLCLFVLPSLLFTFL